MIRNSALALAATMMTTVPVAASAAPVSPTASLSLAPAARASSAGRHHSDLFGLSPLIFVAAVVVVGVGIGAAATNGFSNDNPSSR